MPLITPNLWFDTESVEAAEFYISVFPNSQIRKVSYYGEAARHEEARRDRDLRCRRPGLAREPH